MADTNPSTPSSGTSIIEDIKTGVNNLFRFFSLSDVKSANTFQPYSLQKSVSPPAAQFSAFLQPLQGLTTKPDIDASVKNTLQSFSPVTSYRDVVNQYPDLFQFGLSLQTPLTSQTVSAAVDKGKVIQQLQPEQEGTLWDNLFYQTFKAFSSKTADTIILVLRANNFAKAVLSIPPADQTIVLLNQVANASVVIPSTMVSKERKQSITGSPSVDAATKKVLLQYNTSDIASYHSSILNAAIKEIRYIEVLYNQNEAAAYQTAYNTYSDQVKEIINAMPPQPVPTPEDPFPPYASPNLPPFVYTPKDPFDLTFLVTNMSPMAHKVLEAFRNPTCKNYRDVLTIIEGEQKNNFDAFFANVQQPQKYMRYYGVAIPLSPKPVSNSYIITSETILGSDTLHGVYVTQYFEDPNLRVKSITVVVTPIGGGAAVTDTADTATNVINQSDKHITFLLFQNGLDSTKNYALSATYQIEHSDFTGGFTHPSFKPGRAEYPISSKVSSISEPTPPPPPSNADGQPGNDFNIMYGVNKVGIGDFMRVEQEVCCYVAGEVSHIENVMAREFKEKETRNLTREETSTEETTEREREQLTDTTTTDRHELHSEVSRVLQEDKNTQMGANASFSGEAFGVTIGANTNISTSNGSAATNSFNQAESYAHDVVTRAMERVVEKMTYKRTTRMIREFEETNKHGFDNRLGDKHVVGIYRWVDKILDNRLMNYGKRLMYDFIVPEPSIQFKTWMAQKQVSGTTSLPTIPDMPLHPNVYLVQGSQSLDKYNVANIAGIYGADIKPYPIEMKQVGNSFAELSVPNNADKAKLSVGGFKYDFDIPEGYYCPNISYSFSVVDTDHHDEHMVAHVQIGSYSGTIFRTQGTSLGRQQLHRSISQNNVSFYNYNPQTPNPDTAPITPNPNPPGPTPHTKLPVSVNTFNVGGFTLNVTADCYFHPDSIKAWQVDNYGLIMKAYFERLKEYNDAKTSYDAAVASNTAAYYANQPSTDFSVNPLEARAIEQRELKRWCIELMLAPFGFNDSPSSPVGQNNAPKYLGGQHNYWDVRNQDVKIKRDQFLEDSANYARFIEEAFDWSIMAYVFYPYYWADEYRWSDLIKENSSADYIFQSFLQSGMARVTLPVRPGFENDVLFFLDTGLIPVVKSLLPGVADDTYQDIINLLQLPQPIQVGDSWHTRMPTALTIIQANSSALNQDGLPCSYETDSLGNVVLGPDGKPLYCEDGTPIAKGPSLLGVSIGTPVPSSTCIDYSTQVTALQNSIGTTINAYNTAANPSTLCQATVDALNADLQQLLVLKQKMDSAGCTNVDFTQILAYLTAQLLRIKQVCHL